MDLFNHLTIDTTIITPNSRLSAVLKLKYSEWQQGLQKTSWQTIDCLPLNSFVTRLWQETVLQKETLQPLLLTPEQEQIAWEDILRKSTEHAYLLHISSAAELAKSAWHTLKLWRVNLADPNLTTTEDAATFQRWAQTFALHCQEKNWLDSSSLIELLLLGIKEQQVRLPQKIILMGFTEISPLHQALLEGICQQGCELIHTPLPTKKRHIVRVAMNDTDTEMRSMARWAKAILAKVPAAKIACVVPRLEDVREQVIKHFSAVFCESNTFTLNHTILPFNISAGKNLAAYPVIHCALQLLKFAEKSVPLMMITNLLHSPFIGDAEDEMLKRAQFDGLLRRHNITGINLIQLFEGKLNLSHYCPKLSSRINDIIGKFHIRDELRNATAWTDYFIEQLNLWGWPGERSVDSHEYQAIQAWLKVLTEFATLDNILYKINYQQALHYLIYLTTQKVFQPESPPAPIQILGMLEAAEIPFDHLWIMGLDDSAWPQSPNPNPFIPQRFQKQLKMPHAAAERELQYGIQLTEQLKSCADNIVISHALKSDDAELRPSPIISDIPQVEPQDLQLANFQGVAQTIFAASQSEYLQDEQSLAITAHERIHGGASIFKLQAACPFKAFAELRLHARQIDSPALGLRPMDRGKILHRAMEMLWAQLKDQATLLQQTPEQIQLLVATCADKALHQIADSIANNRRYLLLESQRLQRLLQQWLEHEKNRPAFSVSKIEAEHTIHVAGIPINLRIDRIDTLDDGSELIIDYKTGKTYPYKDWFGLRPNEPQLPLYCTIAATHSQAILFAQINSEEMKWKGVSADDIAIPGVKMLSEERYTDALSWGTQIENWQIILENLAKNFAQGNAKIDPKDIPQTCEHCHLHTLCRIHETLTEPTQS